MKTIRRLIFLIVLNTIIFSGTTYSQESTPSAARDVASLFAYDATQPLNIQESGVEDRDGITIHDVTFSSPVSETSIRAYLVVPSGEGPFAGILYVHWLGDPGTTNRTEFLDEAITLAGRGAVSLLIDAMWSATRWFATRDTTQDYIASINQVIELRRAVDVLLAQPGVDPKRLAYVGHDFGAMYGATLSGVDERIGRYVFIAGTAHYMDWFSFNTKVTGDERSMMEANLSLIDPVNIIGKKIRRPIFFQFSENDRYVSEESRLVLYEAAPSGRRIATYNDGHPMTAEIVAYDRMEWLATQLKLPTQ